MVTNDHTSIMGGPENQMTVLYVLSVTTIYHKAGWIENITWLHFRQSRSFLLRQSGPAKLSQQFLTGIWKHFSKFIGRDVTEMVGWTNASNVALVIRNRDGSLRIVTSSGSRNNIMNGAWPAVCVSYIMAQFPHV